MTRILITGSHGLIGRRLRECLQELGIDVEGLDHGVPADHPDRGNILDQTCVQQKAKACDGIVHLAAVSRVVWGEENPEECQQMNVGGTANILQAARENHAWVLYASSREVYGQQETLPVSEDADYQPMNVYARSKVAAEQLINEGRKAGLQTAVVRFSSVYGSTEDHSDRVLPAFCRAAALGQEVRIDGISNTFDFTYIDDVVDGVVALVQKLIAGIRDLPPIHLTTGHGTTLLEAAQIANGAAGNRSGIREAPPRSYDVSHFIGDPSRAKELLGWEATILPEEGIRRFVAAYQEALRVV